MIDKVPDALNALESLLVFFDKTGIAGLVAILLLGPAAIIVALVVLDYTRQRHARKDAEERRKEIELYRTMQNETQYTYQQTILEILTQYQRDMQNITADMKDKHSEVTQFYKDNVELVKATQRLAFDMRDVITNNTRALEHISSMAKANFFCPVARKNATGQE